MPRDIEQQRAPARTSRALARGGPKQPPPLASINEPFKSVDTSVERQ